LIYGFISLAAAAFFAAGATLPDSRHVITLLQGDESDIAGAIAALVSALFSLAAAYRYFAGQVSRAYKLFEQSLLVNIFMGQVILFFKSQPVALAWLAFTLLLLINLGLLSAEKTPRYKKTAA